MFPMIRLAFIFILLARISFAAVSTTAISDISRLKDPELAGIQYRFKGTVALIAKLDVWLVFLKDSRGIQNIPINPERLTAPIRPGDEIEITGTADRFPAMPTGNCTIRILRHGPPPQPVTPSRAELFNEQIDNPHIRIKGVVRDAFRDEIDPDWQFFVINIDGMNINATCPFGTETQDPDAFVGEEVHVTGIYSKNASRRNFSRPVLIMSGTGDIAPTRRHDIFDVPTLEPSQHGKLSNYEHMGRRRVSGFVRASWTPNAFLLKADDGRILTVQTRQGSIPATDSHVTVSGLPETDYYRIFISHATWKPDPVTRPAPALRYQAITPAEILKDSRGRLKINAAAHGLPVQIVGTIKHLPSVSSDARRIFIDTDGHLIPIDISPISEILPSLQLGCRISVSGICLLEYENNSIPGRFPRVKGFTVVPRAQDDICILSRPSWWTTERLLILLAIFTAILFGVIGWNVLLNRRARIKGQELAEEQIAHVMSELKVSERTRLAVDLHDSMSQTLSGVAMELDAVQELAGSAKPEMNRHLTFAAHAIDNCRIELKNCLWDLRSQALDEQDINQAIRKTLHPSIRNEILTIRFNVPRTLLSDNTTHAILRIIRELASNAVRHGGATSIKIAGAIENDVLRFSVSDNGCGFDPESCPGVSQAHFGLEGIRERVEKLNGDVVISSAPNAGSKITISIPAPGQTN